MNDNLNETSIQNVFFKISNVVFWSQEGYFLDSISCITSILLYFRAEAIYLRLSKSPYVSNAARRVLNLPLITEQDLSQRNILQQNGISPKRRRNQSSGNSESSVEVITELDEESKFENGLMAAGHF